MNKFYITTPIYYVNAKPHIGHAYTTIAADVLARFHKLQGKDVFFLMGTDEHGLKIQKKAEEAGKEPRVFVDEISAEFKSLWEKLDIKYDNFIRTTDEKHIKAVSKMLQTLFENKAIRKGEYEGLYCVGCEQFLNESDLVNGKCPDHDIIPEKMKEESYLLDMKSKQAELIQKIENDEFRITPEKYKKEMLSFLKNNELKDLSISRKNVSWGIPLPFDKSYTTYVWVDAFINYLTGIGWDGNIENIPEFWPANVQFIGKDILRVHATIWPIVLMYLGFPLPKTLFTHGHILSGGKKMSKTLGNTISIDEMLEKFGVDGTRYLLLSAGTFGEDVDVTTERMVEKYNADLANGLGNLLSRVVTLAQNSQFPAPNFVQSQPKADQPMAEISNDSILKLIENIELGQALDYIWNIIKEDDKYINDSEPWKLKKIDPKKFEKVMEKLLNDLDKISMLVAPFMPETSEKIKKALETKKVEPLFQRIK
ncbi:MAG: methionine--tRNA ligase [Candidatus Moranbacteria bacterium RIFOXYA12_FULL_44_15]|nr:MAG: methionine--tRNA ligase [Candidatus Moranbacteria bacterium RIFOXYA12_FULL_44_15]OGI36526.1 MAG: methionine--tRNA ligase [Candidatus Moranbacteria bacterium RIFOXYA2_FULL_43_15]